MTFLFAVLVALVIVPSALSWLEADRDLDGISSLAVKAEEAPDDAQRRRRAAKLWNERLKAMVTFVNGLAIAWFVALAITIPGFGRNALSTGDLMLGLFSAVTLHMFGQAMLSLWKSEE